MEFPDAAAQASRHILHGPVAVMDTLPLVSSGIDTYREPVVYMREDCHVCRSEDFAARTRVRID